MNFPAFVISENLKTNFLNKNIIKMNKHVKEPRTYVLRKMKKNYWSFDDLKKIKDDWNEHVWDGFDYARVGPEYITRDEESFLNSVKRKCTRRTLKYNDDGVPIFTTTFDRQQYFIELSKFKNMYGRISDRLKEVSDNERRNYYRTYAAKYRSHDSEVRLDVHYNRFSLLDVSDIEVDNISLDYEYYDTTKCNVYPRLRRNQNLEDMSRINVGNLSINDKYIEIEKPRNVVLVSKLQRILEWFRNSRIVKLFRINLGDSPWHDCEEAIEMQDLSGIQAEMMDPSSPVEQEQDAGPVVLNAAQQASVSTALEDQSTQDFWSRNSTSDALVNLPHSSSMEVLHASFVWASSDAYNKKLFEYDFPQHVLMQYPDHPACMLFYQYAYWKGDIRVRIHINTTPFHIGTLVFSWYYSDDFDYNVKNRNNVLSGLQLPHVMYNASQGDDVVLDIPFRNYRSMLPTRKHVSKSKNLALGGFRCHVLNPLRLDKDGISVTGYIHVSFKNNEFSGILPRVKTIEPNMFNVSSLVRMAERTLNIIDSVSNMDNPPNVNPPIMYTPQFSDSFSTGTNDVNNIHSLRLNPLGQTQHPVGSSTQVSETKIKDIVRKWGLISSFAWNTDKQVYSNLYSLPVSAELDFVRYMSISKEVNNKVVRMAVIPPVCVMSTINAYNRGSIEFKFQFIYTKFHTGAVMASFTPIMKNVTYTEAMQSYNTTMDLSTNSEYIFKVPYINERPYNPRFNREDSNLENPKMTPIGELNLFVINRLKHVTDISSFVYVNIYMRGGEDFEVAVPVSPLYTIAFDKQDNTPEYIIPHETITQPGAGCATWRYADVIENKMAVCKYSKGDDQILQMNNLRPFCVYQKSWINGFELVGPKFITNIKRKVNGTMQIARADNSWEFVAMLIVNGDKDTYKYVIPFASKDVAIDYVNIHYRLRTNDNQLPDSPTVAQWESNASSLEYYLLITGEGDSYREHNGDSKDCRFEMVFDASVTVQMDNAILADPTISRLTSTMDGMRMFGEQFSDLKDYCRRYQNYCSFNMTGRNNLVARVPITPIGLDVSVPNNGHLLGEVKEGIIPFICSAYRFYRGGLRFKIVFTNVNGVNTVGGHEVFYIQHKPDVVASSRNVSVALASENKGSMLYSGYAYTACSTSVNNNITVEIPCYAPTNLLMLQKPNYDYQSEILHYSLGVLDIYMESPSSNEHLNYHVNIHYSFADDMDISCFIGFPPMMPLFKQVQDEEVYVQCKKDIECQMADEKKEKVELVPEGFWSKSTTRMKDYLGKKAANMGVKQMRENMELAPVSDEENTLLRLVTDTVKKYGDKHKHIIISVISQCIHCIKHPDVVTFVITISTLLAHMGMQVFSMLTKLTTWFRKLFSNRNQPESADDTKTEKLSIEEAKSSIMASIVKAGAETFGKGLDFIRNAKLPDFTSALFNNIRLGALTANTVILFFKNLIEIIPKLFDWLGRYANPMKWVRWMMFNEHKFIIKWLRDVEWITDPKNRDIVLSQSKYTYHTELLVIIGRDLQAKSDRLINKHANYKYITVKMRVLEETYSDIVVTNMNCGSIGVEPFCFCVHGASQLGKTYLTKDLASSCLSHVGYKNYGELFYTRPVHNKFWDGVTNQPILVLDDFCHIKTEENVGTAIGEFLLVKSKATFMPPRADIKDKGRKYNPLIIAMNMNKPYPDFDSVVTEPVAWMNRRDVLIHAEFVPPENCPNAKNVHDLNIDELSKYQHLKFSIHAQRNNIGGDAENEKLSVEVPQVNESGEFIVKDNKMVVSKVTYMNYKQLKFYLSEKFESAYKRIKIEYLKDLKHLQSFYPNADKDFEVNLENYRKYITSVRTSLNAGEMKTITKVDRMMKGLICKECKSNSLCVCEIDYFTCDNVGLQEAQNIDIKEPPIKSKKDKSEEKQDIKEKSKDNISNIEKEVKQNLQDNSDIVGEMADDKPTSSKKNAEIRIFVDWFRDISNGAKMDASMISRIITKNERLNTITDLSKESDAIIAYLLAHVKLTQAFITKLSDKLKQDLYTNNYTVDFKAMLKCACIHTVITYLSHHTPNFVLDYEDKHEYIIVGQQMEYDLVVGDCCKGVIDEREYKKICRVVAGSEYKEYPYLLETAPLSDVVELTRYQKKIRNMRQLYLEELKTEVDSGWLGKVGSWVLGILRPISFVVGTLGAVYVLMEGVHYIADRSEEKQNKLAIIKAQNQARAKFLMTHIPTDECLTNNCMCRGEMAYEQQKPLIEKKRINVKPKDIQVQGEMASDVTQNINNMIKRNTFYLIATQEDGTEVVCRCLGLTGNYFIGLDHYFDKINSLPMSTSIEYVNANVRVLLYYNEITRYKVSNSSFVMCKLPRQISAFKNITHLLISSSMVNNLPRKAYLIECSIPNFKNKMNTYDTIWHQNSVQLHDDTLFVPNILDNNHEMPQTTIENYWSYGTSGKGMCGSVLVTDLNISCPIIGIHVAGKVSGTKGYSELITREILEKLLDSVGAQNIICKDVEIEGQMFGSTYIKIDSDLSKCTAALEGHGNFLGVVPKKYAYSPPTKSKCIHSMCYNEITESTYDVPHLSPKDKRFEGSPMVKGCLHHLNPVKNFPEKILHLAVKDVSELVLAKVVPLRQKIGQLTVQESVCGIPSIPGYDAMEFDTSEGFPFSSVRPKGYSDKKWLFDMEVTDTGYKLNGINDMVIDVMNMKDKQRLCNIVPMTIFIDCLKDLKLPKEKCDKTRIFSISPVDFTIQFRQMFYDFTIAFQNTMFEVESAVGINVDGYEWHEMVQKLMENSPHFVCGDYSKFGPRLMTSCVLAAFDIIQEWYRYYGDTNYDNEKRRIIMGREIAFAKHLMFNLVYEVLSGAPSGCPITTILNNFVNMLYLRCAYIHIMTTSVMLTRNLTNYQANALMSVSSFRKYVCAIFYGDDLIMTVHPSIVKIFNAHNLSGFFQKYDIKFTDALKSGDISKSTGVFDVETSFLKRTIRRHDFRNCFVACMDKRAIEETCNWVFIGHQEPEASILACGCMLLNAHGWGEKYYEGLRTRVIEFWRKHNEVPSIPRWSEVDERIYGY